MREKEILESRIYKRVPRDVLMVSTRNTLAKPSKVQSLGKKSDTTMEFYYIFYGYLVLIVSFAAVITTILQFLSGILVCRQHILNKSTGDASPLPFLSGMLSCGLWLLYGMIKFDSNIIVVNMVGVILMTLYTIIFYCYSIKKMAIIKQLAIMIFLILFVLYYVFTEEDYDLLLSRIGLSSCCLTLVTIASPMSKLFHVIRVKNTDCLPYPMILMSFFVSTLWFLYGLLEQDHYLTVPNLIGATLAISQLSLFIIYPSNSLAKPLLP